MLSAETNALVRNHLIEILTAVIEESDIYPNILELLLKSIISPQKENNPAAYRLAQHVIQKEASRLQGTITQMLVDKQLEGDLKKKEYELIFELNRISSTLLLKVLPMLEQEVMVTFGHSLFFLLDVIVPDNNCIVISFV